MDSPQLEKIFKAVDLPKVLKADNEFGSGYVTNLCHKYKVKLVLSPAYHPQSHGAIERFNRTLKSLLFRAMTLYKSQIWADALQRVIDAYDDTPHYSTRYPPREV
jgi:transposase InsO family protein